MIMSPHFRAAIGLAATTLLITQGCYVYRPTTLPVPNGSEMRVEGARLEIYKGPVVHPAPAECRATRVDGKLFDARGDTLTMVPVRWVRGSSPPRACSRLRTAALVVLVSEYGRFDSNMHASR